MGIGGRGDEAMNDIDVVIPCYNYARFLGACVDSVLQQEGVKVRVLVIDDASGDDTPIVGQRLASSDSRVEFWRHELNRGHIETYNEGLLEWASARYSLLLSADDMVAPGALRRATTFMDIHKGIGMSYGLAVIISDADAPSVVALPNAPDGKVLSGARFLQFCFENAINPVATPTAVVRTELQQRLGGYRANLPHAGDLEMWMRFAANGSVGVIPTVQAYYRWHGANMSTRHHKQLIEDQRQFALACEEMLKEWGEHFPQSSSWLDSFRRAQGAAALWQARNAFERGEPDELCMWLEFAEATHPAVKRSGTWWRLKAKRLVGNSIWRAVRPQLARFVSMTDAPSRAQQETSPNTPGKLFGWWPGET
jgi:GT2 family glycosyltransferase